MRLINDHQFPTESAHVCCFAAGKLVRADDDVLGVKWLEVPLLDLSIAGPEFENRAWQEELLLQLLVLLFTEMCGGDDQNTASAFGPFWGDDQTGFDGLSQAHFICQDSPL